MRNPKQAERDKERREQILKRLEEELKGLNNLKGKHHSKACCRLIAHPTYGRYLKSLKNGELRIDRAKVKEEEKLDGKYLLRTSDETLSAEDVALGYKQLVEVEAAFKTLKNTLELRPVYHRLEDRIRTHVILCWLALLLIRVAEQETGETWNNIKRHLERIHLGR